MSVAQDNPITGLCIVSQKCPPGYVMIEKCSDKLDEANIWSSGQLFAKKPRRFLCITRMFPLDNGLLNNVLVSMVLIDEKELPPSGFSVMAATIDTNEPATYKKLIAVQMVPRSSVRQAVSEIMLLSKSRKLPPQFISAGEIGSLLICYRLSPVPQSNMAAPGANCGPAQQYGSMMPNGQPMYPLTANNVPTQSSGLPSAAALAPQLPYPVAPRASQPVQGNQTPGSFNVQGLARQTSVQASTFKSGPLADVPFELNIHLREDSNFSKMFTPPNFRFRSASDLQQEYSYSFATEEGAAARIIR